LVPTKIFENILFSIFNGRRGRPDTKKEKEMKIKKNISKHNE